MGGTFRICLMDSVGNIQFYFQNIHSYSVWPYPGPNVDPMSTILGSHCKYLGPIFWGKIFETNPNFMTFSTPLANHSKMNFSTNRLCKYEGEGDLVKYTQDVY